LTCILTFDRLKYTDAKHASIKASVKKSHVRDGKFRMKRKRFIILTICVILLVVGIFVAILRPKGPVLYRVTYLPSLGGQFTLPCSINDRGQIAGFSAVKRRTHHLFLWDCEKGIQDLGPVFNNPVYINNAGQIAATMRDSNGHGRAFIWDPNRGRSVLPTLGGKRANAYGINNHGQVVGAAETASNVLHAFVWDSVSGIRDLTASSTVKTRAWSINDAGQVIVFAQGASSRLVNINSGVTSTSLPIPVLGLIEINNNGFIAGVVRTAQGKYDIGIWHPDMGMKKLLKLNMDSSATSKINDVNQVIFAKRQQAFKLFGRTLFYTAAKNYMHDPNLGRISLNGYVSIGRGENLWLTDINHKGCIIGAVQSSRDRRSRGVLLEPIPEMWNK